MRKYFRFLYGFVMIAVLAISTIGATYAYWTATTKSASEELQTGSTIYSISMNINPLYHDFSVIPMNDSDVLKALNNKCRDKYDRGACSAYNLHIYGYNENLDFISGYMDVTTNNMQNLSYMMFRESDTLVDDSCVMVEEYDKYYCVAKEPNSVGDGVSLSLGESYDVTGMTSTNFILLIWLSNLGYSQNDIDIGNFEAVVTMQAGNGGEIKGIISNSINIDSSGDNNEENNIDNGEG